MLLRTIAVAWLTVTLPGFAQRTVSPADAVNPLVGTSAEGQTFPGVGFPFAMTMWTPATSRTEKKAVTAYYYKDQRITDFAAHTF